ncbi:hypothetical protein QBC32DRAFT_201628 [Pseudoneurospora amorphoporcata]|uniref:Secreted protein n=1 Tax=Pseudoneurospora amorphoporcata TaxID=241081 RepID=A0AAN6P3C4_9PEZI|nr:hypothetical protein QBC32DRAFT_201628 [Pseudoneurospora amorphoporcata]
MLILFLHFGCFSSQLPSVPLVALPSISWMWLKCLHMSHDRTNRKRLGLDPPVVTEHLYGLGKPFNIRAQHEHSSF